MQRAATRSQSDWFPGPRAVEVLGPEADMVAQFDPLMLGRTFAHVAAGLGRHSQEVARIASHAARGALEVGTASLMRTVGVRSVAPPFEVDEGDRRFRDPAWDRFPFFPLLQAYLLWRQTMRDLVDAAHLDERTTERAHFGVQLLADALAPTNFLWSNPVALRKAYQTGGRSLVRGSRNFLQDLTENKGRPRQVDTTPFQVGVNLAATPGRVVHRNRLMELIQYSPQTAQVHEVPLLLSPPWINKYYIMDLAPGRSFVEWAVQHGHTVFAISYHNPAPSERDISLDDYMISGPRSALDVIRDITGADKVNIVGLCLGGSLTAILIAYLQAIGEDAINSVTLLNTLLDFTDPGPLGMFTDPAMVRGLEARMQRRGYLGPMEMRGTFDLLRANDLIWSYVVSNWLLGEDPPAFDILAWNADSTRMPHTMHSFYLRSCYLENELARGEMEIQSVRVDLSKISQDMFVVGAENDHIVPWKGAYKTTQLVGGDVDFVLSNAGHIAGIVNPPNPRSRYWTNESNPPDPDQWMADAEIHQGSWWELWAGWIDERAGDLRDPPPTGSDRHPPLADAPGTYVHEK